MTGIYPTIFSFLLLAGIDQCYAYDLGQTQFECYVRNCNGDCAAAKQAAKACNNRIAELRRQAVKKAQADFDAKHQAEINAAKKIDEANKAVHSINPQP